MANDRVSMSEHEATFASRSEDVAELCQRCGVERLDVFGSVTGPDFKPLNSDVDFVVTFHEKAKAKAFDNFFGLREGLEAIFGPRIDLMTAAQIRNPFLVAAVEKNRRTIYGA
jgi:uncharacterized protein